MILSLTIAHRCSGNAMTKKTADDYAIEMRKTIMNKTGLSQEVLDTMDIGDIERHMGIKATDPAKRKLLSE